MYDAIVVGARCAGSPTAMLLARKGYRVLLVDRATFPSDTLSTHFIRPSGVAQLRRWGLLDRVVASGCPPIRRFRLEWGHLSLAGSPPPRDGVAESYAPRRTVLDTLLANAAVSAGAEFRDGFAVHDLLWDGDRVTGIRGQTRHAAVVREEARIVIGADGRHSRVAQAVRAPAYLATPPLGCAYYTYWSGIALDSFEGYFPDRRVILLFPTNDGLVCSFLEWPATEFHSVRHDLAGTIQRTLALLPRLAARLAGATQEERWRGTAELPNFFRKPYGPGWALGRGHSRRPLRQPRHQLPRGAAVGDAGYHKDPLPAYGIADAFRDAELLAEAIHAGFAGRCALEAALADYEQQRNQVAMPLYEHTCRSARLEPPTPEMLRLAAALQGIQVETDRFVGAFVGTVAREEFFAPDHVQRILDAANQSAA